MAALCHKKGEQVLSFMWQRDAGIVQRITFHNTSSGEQLPVSLAHDSQ